MSSNSNDFSVKLPVPVSSTESLADYNRIMALEDEATNMDSDSNSQHTEPQATPVISPSLANSKPAGEAPPSVSLPPAQQNTISLANIPQIAATHPTGSIPEFLYQLTKMLTDDNREVIEWEDSKIKVHNPFKLESNVLGRYFRHSKFASFQRQLNYFGFRKIAGKGKMAPCAYVNDSAKGDINNLLLIKRKSGTTNLPLKDMPPRRESSRRALTRKVQAMKDNESYNSSFSSYTSRPPAAPLKPSSSLKRTEDSQQDIARSAVGRGIRHGYLHNPSIPLAQPRSNATFDEVPDTSPPRTDTSETDKGPDDRKSSGVGTSYDPTPLNEMPRENDDDGNLDSFFERNSSLLDLAMIPGAEDFDNYGDEANEYVNSQEWNFIDFPQPEIDPRNISRS